MRNYYGVTVQVKVPAIGLFGRAYEWQEYRVTHQEGFDDNATPKNEDDLLVTMQAVGRPAWPAPLIVLVPRKVLEFSEHIKIPLRP